MSTTIFSKLAMDVKIDLPFNGLNFTPSEKIANKYVTTSPNNNENKGNLPIFQKIRKITKQ